MAPSRESNYRRLRVVESESNSRIQTYSPYLNATTDKDNDTSAIIDQLSSFDAGVGQGVPVEEMLAAAKSVALARKSGWKHVSFWLKLKWVVRIPWGANLFTLYPYRVQRVQLFPVYPNGFTSHWFGTANMCLHCTWSFCLLQYRATIRIGHETWRVGENWTSASNFFEKHLANCQPCQKYVYEPTFGFFWARNGFFDRSWACHVEFDPSIFW